MTKIKKNTTGKPTTATPLSPMMTVAEVAELLGFGQNFVYRLVSKLPSNLFAKQIPTSRRRSAATTLVEAK